MIVALGAGTVAVGIAARRRVDGFHEPVGIEEGSFEVRGLERLVEVVVLDVESIGRAVNLINFDDLKAVRLRRGIGLPPVLGRTDGIHDLQFRVAAVVTPVSTYITKFPEIK